MAGPGGEGQPSLGFSCLTRSKIVDSLTSIKFERINQNLTSSGCAPGWTPGPWCGLLGRGAQPCSCNAGRIHVVQLHFDEDTH